MNRLPRLRRLAPSLARAIVAGCVMVVGCVQTNETPKPKIRYTSIPKDKSLPALLDGTIYERTILANDTPYAVSAYGLIGQLRGTGDCTAPTSVRTYMSKEIARHKFGDATIPGYGNISSADVLKDPHYAIVVVEGQIPPGARKDDWIDVRVSCLPNNNTKSLAHGVLFETDLKNAGANRDNPSGAVNSFVRVKGPVLVNPAYALDDATNPTGPAKVSLRKGTVLYNGKVMQDRPILLRLREPSRLTSRAIEARIWDRFQPETVATAEDEGVVQVYVPRAFRGDYEHFLGVVRHMWLVNTPEFNAAKAKMLVAEATKPNAPLEDISYCWEGIGKDALPFIQPLLTDGRPDVAFAAARAAVFIGDPTGAAESRLVQMARTPQHPFRLSAVQTLGGLPPSSALNHLVRELLDSDQATVRIAAYEVLARPMSNGSPDPDPSVYRTFIHPPSDPSKMFLLDVVPSEGPPLIFATQQGVPRIAVIGKTPELRLPVTFVAMGSRFTISSVGKDRAATIYHRDPMREDPVKVVTSPDLPELIARLGGAGPRDEQALDLTYGEVVAILQSLADQGQLIASDARGQWACSFVLQPPPQLREVIIAAPTIAAGQTGPAGPGGTGTGLSPRATAQDASAVPQPGDRPVISRQQ
jgi:Flagellar P-ring protein